VDNLSSDDRDLPNWAVDKKLIDLQSLINEYLDKEFNPRYKIVNEGYAIELTLNTEADALNMEWFDEDVLKVLSLYVETVHAKDNDVVFVLAPN
jgi:hypothetical protein